MIPLLLLSFVNVTGVWSIQPLQITSYPAVALPPPPCGVSTYPPETSFSPWNGTRALTVCRTPDLAVTRWDGQGWTLPRPLPPSLTGGNLRTASAPSGDWWVALSQGSAPSAGGNGGPQRSLVVSGTTFAPVLNTTLVSIQDIQWSLNQVYTLASTRASSTGGTVGLYQAGIGTIDPARDSVAWLPGTMRPLSIQAFSAPVTPTGPLYMIPYGPAPMTLERWDLNHTSALWTITDRIPLTKMTFTPVLRILPQDGALWLLTTQQLVSVSLTARTDTVLLTNRPGLSYLSMVMTYFNPSPTATQTQTATASPSATSSATASASSSASVSSSASPSATTTASQTSTPTPSPTLGSSVSSTPTQAVSPTQTTSPGLTPSRTTSSTLSPTRTTTATATPSHTPSATPTPTATLSQFASPSTTPTPTSTRTQSATPTPTQSSTFTPTQSPTLSPSPTAPLPIPAAAATSSDLSPGAKAGISLGVLAGLGLTGAAGYGLYHQGRRPARQFRKPKGVPVGAHPPAFSIDRVDHLRALEEARLNSELTRTTVTRTKVVFNPIAITSTGASV